MKLIPTLACLSGAVMLAGAAMAQAPATPAAPRPAGLAPPARGPSLALSMEAAQEALAVCDKAGFKVSATVLDSAGIQKVLLAADGAGMRPVTSSTAKALNVIKTGHASSVSQAQAEKDPAYAAEVAKDATQMARAGAVPLMVGGTLIGAIGVGGANPSTQDETCAKAGADKIAARLN